MRETANEIAWLQIQSSGERTQDARAEQRMQLFAEDRDVHVAAEPRTRDRAQAQLFHALHDAADGTMSLYEVGDGRAECFAGRLSPP